jgi:outer membrane protein assembly factor BamB
VRIIGSWTLYLFEHDDRGGGIKEITSDVANLAGWTFDETASSADVEPTGTCKHLGLWKNPDIPGTINRNPGPNCGDGYFDGTWVQLEIVPVSDTGYIFSHWSGNVSGASTITSLQIWGESSAIANFTRCFSLTTIPYPTAGGAISVSPAPNCGNGYNTGTYLTLVANTNAGYSFGTWSNHASGDLSITFITMDSDKAAVANFVPAAPSDLQITNTTDSSVTISWRDNSVTETAFKIYRWNGTDYAELATTGPNVTSYTDTNLTCGSDYYYIIAALDNVGYSQVAGSIKGTTGICNTLATSSWPMFRSDPRHTGRSTYSGPTIPTLKWVGNYLIYWNSPVIAPDGTVYAADGNRIVYALNPNGTPKWSYNVVGVFLERSSAAIALDGTLYQVTDWGLFAIKPDGTLKWSNAFGGMGTAPAIATDGTIYSPKNDKLYALNSNGTLKWTLSLGGFTFQSAPAIATDGTVYVRSYTSGSSYLNAVNPDGTLKWINVLATSGATSGVPGHPAIGMDGTVYVTAHIDTGKLFAINPNGTSKWSYSGVILGAPAIGTDGTLYIGDTTTSLLAINPNGALKWSAPIGGTASSYPVIGADGTVYVGSTDGKLYAVSPSGVVLWSYSAGGSPRVSPAIGPNQMIYFTGGDEFKLYAIGQDNTKRNFLPMISR